MCAYSHIHMHDHMHICIQHALIMAYLTCAAFEMYYMTVTCIADYGNMFFLLIGGFSGIFFIFLLQTQSAYCSSSGPVGRVLLLPTASCSWPEWFGVSAEGVLRNHGNCFLQPRDQALSLVRGGRNAASCVQICDSRTISPDE